MPGCCAAVERIEELELMLRGRRAELGHTRAALTTSRDGHRAAQRVIAELEAERAELMAMLERGTKDMSPRSHDWWGDEHFVAGKLRPMLESHATLQAERAELVAMLERVLSSNELSSDCDDWSAASALMARLRGEVKP